MTRKNKNKAKKIELSDTTTTSSGSGGEGLKGSDGTRGASAPSPAPNAIFVKGVFQFGKYSKRNIEEVFQEDPKYCEWYVRTIKPEESKHKAYAVDKLTHLFEEAETN